MVKVKVQGEEAELEQIYLNEVEKYSLQMCFHSQSDVFQQL